MKALEHRSAQKKEGKTANPRRPTMSRKSAVGEASSWKTLGEKGAAVPVSAQRATKRKGNRVLRREGGEGASLLHWEDLLHILPVKAKGGGQEEGKGNGLPSPDGDKKRKKEV